MTVSNIKELTNVTYHVLQAACDGTLPMRQAQWWLHFQANLQNIKKKILRLNLTDSNCYRVLL